MVLHGGLFNYLLFLSLRSEQTPAHKPTTTTSRLGPFNFQLVTDMIHIAKYFLPILSLSRPFYSVMSP